MRDMNPRSDSPFSKRDIRRFRVDGRLTFRPSGRHQEGAKNATGDKYLKDLHCLVK